MAEYIDREKIQWHCEYENPHLCNKEDCKNNCPNLECSYQEVMQIPTADVIERDKVAKAIEEMEIEYNNLTYTENHNLGASYGIRKSIEILKRNVGE